MNTRGAMRTGLNVIVNIISVFCTSLYHHGFALYVRNCTGTEVDICTLLTFGSRTICCCYQ